MPTSQQRQNRRPAEGTAPAPAPAQTVTWGDPSKQRLLGKRNPRPEGPDKVSGRAKYASDIVLPGMCYGRYVMSPHPAADVVKVDTSAAEALAGVKGVLVMVGDGGTVVYHGQPVAVVAAITPDIAEDAARLVRVEYKKKPHVVDFRKSPTSGVQVDPKQPKDNLVAPGSKSQGNVDDAFAQCAAVHEGTYEAQTRLHCCLETHGHTAKWDGDQLTVWSSTQFVQGVRDGFAQKYGGPEKVKVICEHMGGGFGSKFGAGPEGDAAVRLAKQINAPVKFMLSREEEQLAPYRGPGLRARVKLGATADGNLLAADSECWGDGGPVNSGATPLENEGSYVVSAKNWRVKRSGVLTNTAGTNALRAPGHPQAGLIWDMALDELAAKLNMDPVEFRKKNESDPVRVQEWELGAKIIGWDRRQKTPGSAPGVKKRGIGMGSAKWGGGGRQSADCTLVIGKDGSVQSFSGTQDLGTGLRTFQSAIVAEELGLELKDVTPKIGHSVYGPGHPSGGSTTTGSAAPPIKMAAVNAKAELIQRAAKSLGVRPEDVDLQVGGKFVVKEQPGKSLTWKQLCATLPADGLTVKGTWNRDLQAGGVRGCTFAEVEVDTETGKVTVLKVVGIQDCGFVLNRLQAENQVTGGIIQGIGTAILEDRRMDDLTGRMLNPNFERYKLCGTMEAGGINITMDPPYRTLGANERGIVAIAYDNPTGKVSGVGEPAIIAVHSAIANAVFNAIGVQVREQPASPDRVLAALAAKKKGATA